MHSIRSYQDRDHEMLTSWWHEARETAPGKSLMPATSWILEIEGIPALSISLITTNVKGLCYLENFIGNPNLPSLRKGCSQIIVDHAINEAKKLGFERVICFSYKDKVGKHYEKLGMTPTLSGLSSYVKEIE